MYLSEISNEIRAKVLEAERGLADPAFNHHVDKLDSESIELSTVEEDLSDVVRHRVSNLLKASVSPAEITRLLKSSSKPRLVTLDVVENEIASVIVGELEIGLPSDTVRKIKSLSLDQFQKLKGLTKAKHSSQDSESIMLDCRFDRWVLVVSEDSFLESSSLLLRGSNHEV